MDGYCGIETNFCGTELTKAKQSELHLVVLKPTFAALSLQKLNSSELHLVVLKLKSTLLSYMHRYSSELHLVVLKPFFINGLNCAYVTLNCTLWY